MLIGWNIINLIYTLIGLNINNNLQLYGNPYRLIQVSNQEANKVLLSKFKETSEQNKKAISQLLSNPIITMQYHQIGSASVPEYNYEKIFTDILCPISEEIKNLVICGKFTEEPLASEMKKYEHASEYVNSMDEFLYIVTMLDVQNDCRSIIWDDFGTNSVEEMRLILQIYIPLTVNKKYKNVMTEKQLFRLSDHDQWKDIIISTNLERYLENFHCRKLVVFDDVADDDSASSASSSSF